MKQTVLRTLTGCKRLCTLNHNISLTFPRGSGILYPTIPSTPLNDAHQEGYSFLIIEPQTTWPQRLQQQHLQSLDPALIPDMGFPEDWQSRPIWKGILPRGGER